MSISMSFFSRKAPQSQPQTISKPLNNSGAAGGGGGGLVSSDPFASSSNVATTSPTQTTPTRHGKRSGSFRAENTFAPPMNKLVKSPSAQARAAAVTTTTTPTTNSPAPPVPTSPQQKRSPPPQLRPQDGLNRTPSPNPNYTQPISNPITAANSGPDPRDVARPYSTPYPPPAGPLPLPPPMPTGPPGPSLSRSGSLDKDGNGNAGGDVTTSLGFQPGEEFIPAAERGINTKSGGTAGMAGVGRRGFAAAARAAMFVNQNVNQNVNQQQQQQQQQGYGYPSPNVNMGVSMGMGGMGMQQRPPPPPPNGGFPGYPYGGNRAQGQGPGPNPNPNQNQNQIGMQPNQQSRRPFAPPQGALRALDMDSLSRSNNGTPPLSSGSQSGYSSPSPGLPTPRPFQQQNDFAPVAFPSTNSKVSPITPKPLVGINTGATPLDSRSSPPPASPESEYGGLAYADSDGDEPLSRGVSLRSATSSMRSGSRKESMSRPGLSSPKAGQPSQAIPIPIPLTPRTDSSSGGMPRTMSTSSSKSGKSIQFGSVSSRSRSVERSRRLAGPSSSSVTSGSSMSPPLPRGAAAHSRDGSVSSTYSQSSDDESGHGHGHGNGEKREVAGRTRAGSSAAIAHALGLSQRPPSDYPRLGGPGVNGAPGRSGRSASNASSRAGGPGGGGYEKREKDTKNHERDGSITSNIDLDLRRITTTTDGGDDDRRMRLLGVQLKDKHVEAIVDARAPSPDSNAPVVVGSDEAAGLSAGAKTQRSKTVQGIQSPDQKPIKLPTRSMTSPQLDRDKALVGSGAARTVRRLKICNQCSKTIEDGRWVSVHGGGVLCERCWKNTYLPKCQRCELPIERQAVSSSDGQLKGKYHKDCFNCSVCFKPFPDKSFYVHDGRPLCAYHYHEANDTLCAAAMCGQPIEGPCAISQSGDRYHPEHMTCEHPGYPQCPVLLVEYWEVDGRMLCERHASWAGRSRGDSGSEDEDDDWERRRDLRAMKRVTKFIDLAAGGGLGPLAGVPAGGGGDDIDSGLR